MSEKEQIYVNPLFDDMNVYLHLTHLHYLFGTSKQSLPAFLAINASWPNSHNTQNLPSYEELMHAFNLYPPKVGWIVKALSKLGFSPYTIADMLDITKQSVSYHLSKGKIYYYECAHYRSLIYGRYYSQKYDFVYNPEN